MDGGDLWSSRGCDQPHVSLTHQLKQETLHEAVGGAGDLGEVLASGEQESGVEAVEDLYQSGVLLRLARADPALPWPGSAPPVLVHQPLSAEPLRVGHHEVRHHSRPLARQVAAPLTPTARLLVDRARFREHLALVARPLVVHPLLDRPPPEALAALAGLDPVVDPRGLVSAHNTQELATGSASSIKVDFFLLNLHGIFPDLNLLKQYCNIKSSTVLYLRTNFFVRSPYEPREETDSYMRAQNLCKPLLPVDLHQLQNP